MVAIRSLLMLSAVGIASAGKCKPESSGFTTLTKSVALTTAATTTVLSESTAESTVTKTASSTISDTESTTVLESTTIATTVADETTTETASGTISTDVAESSQTTLATSLITSSEDASTTTEAATTTTAAAPATATCPSEVDQCIGTMKIQCGVVLVGLSTAITVSDLNACVQTCAQDAGCAGFTYLESSGYCFTAQNSATISGQRAQAGWDAGIKGSC
ncbi:hypothetical protein F53441_928 [Fusarium austroafricanum]|uniref:Apple domain-containing protein n=1 Tax=Fusarium austroafricanum TaxID=2364996 RepID=A0A8H4P2W3_9HYPO|nr:hypothetical protein F53441_928 [Fusarium austroafricanum]